MLSQRLFDCPMVEVCTPSRKFCSCRFPRACRTCGLYEHLSMQLTAEPYVPPTSMSNGRCLACKQRASLQAPCLLDHLQCHPVLTTLRHTLVQTCSQRNAGRCAVSMAAVLIVSGEYVLLAEHIRATIYDC